MFSATTIFRVPLLLGRFLFTRTSACSLFTIYAQAYNRIGIGGAVACYACCCIYPVCIKYSLHAKYICSDAIAERCDTQTHTHTFIYFICEIQLCTYICNEHFWLDYGNSDFVVPYRNKNLNGIELGRDKDWKHWNCMQFNVHTVLSGSKKPCHKSDPKRNQIERLSRQRIQSNHCSLD